MDIKGILFDKDGTLFDFAQTWEAWTASFLIRVTGNAEQANDLGRVIGFDLTTRKFLPGSVVVAGTPEEIALALLPHMPGHDLPGLLEVLDAEASEATQVEAVPLAPFLDGLRASGYRLGVATNDTEAPARVHLDAAGVIGKFDFIAGFDSGHGAKPGPGQLLAFCKALDLPPERCVMVGDSRHDLDAGRAAGFATVGVLTGLALADELADLADVVLPDIGHLPTWLDMKGKPS